MSTDSPLIHQLVSLGIEREASDLLLCTGSPPALRIHGKLQPLELDRLDGSAVRTAIEAIISPSQQEQWERTRHLDFGLTFSGRRLRGSAAFAEGVPTLALRIFPGSIPTPADLGLPQVLVDMLRRDWGLLIVTGPAGHGKTTTLASLLDVINRKETKHIMTVEDPIEYAHTPNKSLIDHQEVGTDTPTFASALKQILRHNPDVLMVGEVRDRESVEAALTVAETGHLVMTTMHANDTVQALDRIMTFFPRDEQPFVQSQLAMVMAGIVNQRLVRGLKGPRVLAAEVLMNSHSVSHLIREGRTAQLHSALETERARGSVSMNHALAQLVDDGKVHVAEARRYINPLESDRLLGRD